jgi:hypothetical protein
MNAMQMLVCGLTQQPAKTALLLLTADQTEVNSKQQIDSPSRLPTFSFFISTGFYFLYVVVSVGSTVFFSIFLTQLTAALQIALRTKGENPQKKQKLMRVDRR